MHVPSDALPLGIFVGPDHKYRNKPSAGATVAREGVQTPHHDAPRARRRVPDPPFRELPG